jgi:hypothetical protein
MKVVNDIWRQLVGRRLLPLAIILVAALVAVPIVLAKGDQPASEPTLKPVDASAAAATKTIVALAEPATKRRVVLGAKTNPFAGEKLPKPKVEKAATPAAAKSQSPDGGGGTAPGTPASPQGGASPPAGGSPTPPASGPTTPAPKPKTYDRYELTVRFGSAEGSPERRSLKRLQPLPSADEPVLIYLGVLKDGKTAEFLLDDGVSPVGDGECHPGPEQCETIRLKAGETEFFDVSDPETGEVGEQYQLDLVKIHKSSTTSATQARASSKAGRRLLKARASSAGYRWPGKTLRATFAGATVALP